MTIDPKVAQAAKAAAPDILAKIENDYAKLSPAQQQAFLEQEQQLLGTKKETGIQQIPTPVAGSVPNVVAGSVSIGHGDTTVNPNKPNMLGTAPDGATKPITGHEDDKTGKLAGAPNMVGTAVFPDGQGAVASKQVLAGAKHGPDTLKKESIKHDPAFDSKTPAKDLKPLPVPSANVDSKVKSIGGN